VLQSEVFWVALIREYHGDFWVALIRVHRGVFWVDPIRQYRRTLLDLNKILGRKLNVSEVLMRPGRVTEGHLDPCLVQTDCRYDEGPLWDAEKVA
jgi:hypothetical protein